MVVSEWLLEYQFFIGSTNKPWNIDTVYLDLGDLIKKSM